MASLIRRCSSGRPNRQDNISDRPAAHAALEELPLDSVDLQEANQDAESSDKDITLIMRREVFVRQKSFARNLHCQIMRVGVAS